MLLCEVKDYLKKIVIFSDSHSGVETMRVAVEKEKPDMIIHLGDCIADAERLRAMYPSTSMIKVLGNVDSVEENEALIKVVDLYGKRFVITHGHMFIPEYKDYQTDENRMISRNNMLKAMLENNADILLHGHTHEPYINRMQAAPGKPCWIMNPGSVRRTTGGAGKPTYGVLNINEARAFEWRLVEVES